MTMTICWPEPPANAVRWETECGQYRIDFDGVSYTPRRLVQEPVSLITTIRHWLPVAPDQPTLDAAMSSINDYHCQAYHLIPY